MRVVFVNTATFVKTLERGKEMLQSHKEAKATFTKKITEI